MKSFVKWFGIVALIAILGFSMAACDDGSTGGGGTDIWSNVTNISQINGTWKAPSSVTYNVEGITVIMRNSNYTVTFNATAKAMTASGTITQTYSGGDIDTQWPSMKTKLQSQYNGLNGITLTFNDANHSYTMTYNNFSWDVSADFTRSGFQINQNGTKLKIPPSEDLGVEIIYTKQ
jgi:uncharacterized lipoprotein YehR (DUF1307 family)